MDILKLFGPPGTGKTYRLLQIMEQELKRGVAPERMAYLSFTVQARREATRRAMDKFNLTRDQLPYFRTLHAICYRELEPGKQAMLIGTKDLHQFGARLGLTFSQQDVSFDLDLFASDGSEDGDRLLKFDHLRRHLGLPVRHAWRYFPDHDGLTIFTAERFCKAYGEWKEDEGRYDFTDLLQQAHDPLPVDVVIVDEAQDLSRLQWRTLHRLSQSAQRMYMAGDDDQAIFTWAGASPTAFREQPGTTEVLNQSYRIPQTVHDLATRVVERIADRQPKDWKARDEVGKVRFLLDPQQVEFPTVGSVLLLYRHHFQSRDLEERLRQQGLPYLRNDKPASGTEWAKAIVAWEQLRKGKTVTWQDAMLAVKAMSVGHDVTQQGFSAMERQPGKLPTTMKDLLGHGVVDDQPWFVRLRRIPTAQVQYMRAIIRQYGAEGLTQTPRIRCSTIHAAKGAEAEHVVVVGDLASRSQQQFERDPDSERRVFYVGLTRAKSTLTIVGNDNPILAPLFRSHHGR